MKLLIKIIERRLNKRFEGELCDEGARIIRFFKKDYPNGVKLTRDEFEKFIKKHRLSQFDVGLICNELFMTFGNPAKATILDEEYSWRSTRKKVMLDRFFKLAKNTKLLK